MSSLFLCIRILIRFFMGAIFFPDSAFFVSLPLPRKHGYRTDLVAIFLFTFITKLLWNSLQPFARLVFSICHINSRTICGPGFTYEC